MTQANTGRSSHCSKHFIHRFGVIPFVGQSQQLKCANMFQHTFQSIERSSPLAAALVSQPCNRNQRTSSSG
jgi:hypothetical protein